MGGRRVGLSVAAGLGLLAAGAVPFVALGDQQGVAHPRAMPERPAAASAPAFASSLEASRTPLIAPLSGRNEVSSETGRRGVGDPDGTGLTSVVMKGGQLCFAITVQGIGPSVGLHIHEGRSNRNGDVVVSLTPPPAAGDPGASAGCVAIEADLARQIAHQPHAFYVNIHTAEFAAGALRGQLRRAPNG